MSTDPTGILDQAASAPTGRAPVVIPASRTGDRVGSAVMALLGFLVIEELVRNPNFQWGVVFRYLFEPVVLWGLGLTLWLTVASMAIGLLLGAILAVMRMSSRAWLRVPAGLYLWFFRGTPLLVQLIFWYNMAFLYPEIRIGLPFGPVLYSGSVNDLITPYSAALLGLALNEGAYMAEIVRAGILSVDPGQQEAGRALGMTPAKILRQVVLPQALRIIIPPTGNQTIGMLKTTSMVSVIALYDLLYAVQTIASRTFQTIPLLIVASIWYLVLTTVLSLVQSRIEKYFASKSIGGGVK
ncbi:MAG TPA: amino acid ABC transporter permease [Paenirhodobacter sp.]